jgi:hypothetical protein
MSAYLLLPDVISIIAYNFSIFAVIFYASAGFQHLERLKD